MNQEDINSIKGGSFPYRCEYDPRGKKSSPHWKVYQRMLNLHRIDSITPADEMLNLVCEFTNKSEAKIFFDLYLAPLIEKAIYDKFEHTEEYQRIYKIFPMTINNRLIRAKILLGFHEYTNRSHELADQEYNNFCNQLNMEI